MSPRCGAAAWGGVPCARAMHARRIPQRTATRAIAPAPHTAHTHTHTRSPAPLPVHYAHHDALHPPRGARHPLPVRWDGRGGVDAQPPGAAGGARACFGRRVRLFVCVLSVCVGGGKQDGALTCPVDPPWLNPCPPVPQRPALPRARRRARRRPGASRSRTAARCRRPRSRRGPASPTTSARCGAAAGACVCDVRRERRMHVFVMRAMRRHAASMQAHAAKTNPRCPAINNNHRPRTSLFSSRAPTARRSWASTRARTPCPAAAASCRRCAPAAPASKRTRRARAR